MKDIPKKWINKDGIVDDNFARWQDNVWIPAVAPLEVDRNVLFIWSDGSVQEVEAPDRPDRAAGAYVLLRSI